jgi:glycine cleavage system H protein
MPDFPSHLRYTPEHVWVRALNGGPIVRVGITDYAQQQLGDIVAVSLPSVGMAVQTAVACADVESTKSIADVDSPVTGTVVARNSALDQTPEAINTSPYDDGWLFDVQTDPGAGPAVPDALLDASAYARLVGD